MTDTIKKLDKLIEDVKAVGGSNADNLLAVIEFAKAMQPRSIEEAPDGVFVFGFCKYWAHPSVCYRNGDFWFDEKRNGIPQSLFPTHFTPLPDQALKDLEEALK